MIANVLIGGVIFGYAGWMLVRHIKKSSKGKCASCSLAVVSLAIRKTVYKCMWILYQRESLFYVCSGIDYKNVELSWKTNLIFVIFRKNELN